MAAQKPTPAKAAWYEVETERVASAAYAYALVLEAQLAPRRAKYNALYRLVTGEEPPVTAGLWMSRRSASSSTVGAGYSWAKPYDNIMRNACSVLENRLGTVQPFVQISPKGVSFAVRDGCKIVTDLIDNIFDDNRYAGIDRTSFRDMFIDGNTYRGASSIVENGEKKLIQERIEPYLILVDEISFRSTFPTDAIRLHPYRRSEAMAIFGQDDAEIQQAIRLAPSAFWSGSGALADEWIFIVEATKLPNAAGEPGRRVFCLQNKVISDTPYNCPRFRWTVARWEPPSERFYANGGAHILCPYQMEINGLDQRIRAGIDANAFTGFIAADGTGLTAQTMGSKPGFLWKYSGGAAPEQITPVPFPPQLYEYRKQKVNDAYAAVGLTMQNIQGAKEQGVTSGKSLRLAIDYSDARNKSLVMALEELGAGTAERVIDEGEEVKPTVYTSNVGNHTLSWDDFSKAIKRDSYKITPFPVNSYIGTPGEDAQDAADDYADQLIDKRAYMRLSFLPDLTTYQTLATSSADLIEDTLDEIVRKGKFIAPEQTYDDMGAAFDAAQKRYNLEKRYKTDRKTLRALYQFMQVIADRIKNPSGQTLQPPLPAVAPSPTPSLADAMPPPQISPAMMPPAQLAPPSAPPQMPQGVPAA